MDTARTLIADPSVRLLSVVGPSGVGKTRLARELVNERGSAGQALFVPLASVRDDEMVLDAVVDALPDHPRWRTGAVDALWSTLGGQPLLLVLDNVEQVQGAASVVHELIQGYESVTVLTTSLRPLGVGGERVLRLRPFPPVGLATADHPAVHVFLDRAGAADAEFRPDTDGLADIAALCDELGGLPLAIELAASRVGVLPPAVILDQIRRGHDLALLRDEVVGGEPRHASISDAMEWSYDLLPAVTQGCLRRVAVFEGPFALEAAHAIAEPDADETDVFESLSDLVDLQLLDLVLPDNQAALFSAPPLVRSFARERLRTSGEWESALDRHSQWFRSRCIADPQTVRASWPDVALALDTAVEQGHLSSALRAAVSATPAFGQALGAGSLLSRRIENLIAGPGDDDPGDLIRALLWTTMQPPDRQGQLESVGRWVADRTARALSAARASGDPEMVLQALELAVVTMPTTLDVPGAIGATKEGLELASRIGNQAMWSRFEVFDAVIARQGGDVTAAVAQATSALIRARACGDIRAEVGATLILLGAPVADLPVIDPPLPSLRDLLNRCEEAGDLRDGSIIASILAAECLAGGDIEAAAHRLLQSLEWSASLEVTDPFLSVAAVPLLTLVALAAGDAESAVGLSASLAPVEDALRASLPPDVWPPYDDAVAMLRASVPSDTYTAWVSAATGLTLPQINRHAQGVARRLAGPRPAATAPAQTDEAPRRPGQPALLTPRQTEVLRALSSGRTYKEIGDELGMTAKTVMHHSAEIYRRLGVRGRGEATVWAYRHGLAADPRH